MKFKPNDKVRIVACENPELKCMIGTETSVTEYHTYWFGGSGWWLETRHPIDGRRCVFAEHHLEPIIPTGESDLLANIAKWKDNNPLARERAEREEDLVLRIQEMSKP
jgi:hypothetical protein